MPAKPLMTRKQLAAVITETLFPVSARQLSTWPLKVRYVGREGLVDPDEGMAMAKDILENAPLAKQCPANLRKQHAA